MFKYLNDSNIFEPKTGVLNLAPLKISGIYKIIVDKNGDLYLDNYSDRRIIINKNQRFIPQLCNFLSVGTNIQDSNIFDKIKYGAHRVNQKLYYHTTLYLNDNDYPDFFWINKINFNSNLNLTNEFKFNENSTNIDIISLQDVGLKNIFNEINDNISNYPIYLNFEESKIVLFGLDYIKGTIVKKEIDIVFHLANQNYYNVINNFVINQFIENNIIFPRFLNIEFEFSNNEQSIDTKLFDNFYGYYTNCKEINESDSKEINSDIGYIKSLQCLSKESILPNSNKIIHTQILDKNNIDFNSKYDNLKYTVSFNNASNNTLFARLKFNYLYEDDIIEIYDENDNLFFEYIVSSDDVGILNNKSFKEVLLSVAKNIQNKSDNQIYCTVVNNDIIEFNISSINYDNKYFYFKSVSNKYYQFIDELNTNTNPYLVDNNSLVGDATKLFFVNTIDTDLLLDKFFSNLNELKQSKVTSVLIDNKFYNIKNIYQYKNDIVLRLPITKIIDNINVVFVNLYSKSTLKVYLHIPIQFFNYVSNTNIVSAQEQFNFEQYITELKYKFILSSNSQDTNELVLNTINEFSKNNIYDILPYVQNSINTDKIENSDKYCNTKQVLNIKFNFGFNSFITNNLLNFDYQFYDDNGCTNLYEDVTDNIRFHWFLIKGEIPKYINNDKHSFSKLRYFNDKPKITSKLVFTGNHCETIFLGVKYRLPRKYNGYSFAVYLDANNISNHTPNTINDDSIYFVEINNQLKTIYLKINKYLDFIDLIRGTFKNNKPFIDLSFFYTVNKSFNTNSDLVFSFKDGGLLLCDNIKPVNYDTKITNDWKLPVFKNTSKPIPDNVIFNPTLHKYIICLKKVDNVFSFNLTDILPSTGNYSFYIYSSIKIGNKQYDYISVEIKLIDILSTNDDYVWCNDIEIKFYDTNRLLVYKELDSSEDLLKLTTNPKNSPPNDDYELIDNTNINQVNKYTTIINVNGKQLRVLNSFTFYKFSEEYYEYIFDETYIPDTNSYKKEYQKFNLIDGYKVVNKSDIVNVLLPNDVDYLNEFGKQIITLFNRNQLWYLIKELINTELKVKNITEKQITNYVNELLLSNLYEYSNLHNLPIETNIGGIDKFIRINVEPLSSNMVIWNIDNVPNLVRINRYSSPYYPSFDTVLNTINFQIEYENDLPTNQYVNIFNNRIGNILLNRNNINSNSDEHSQIGNSYNFDINSIGLWTELSGNFISSMFVKNNDITITIKNSLKSEYLFTEINSINANIDISENLLGLFTFNGFIDSNEKYLNTIDKNINKYIIDTGFRWLLNFYEFTEIYDIDNKRIDFDVDLSNNKLSIKNHQLNGYYKLILKRIK